MFYDQHLFLTAFVYVYGTAETWVTVLTKFHVSHEDTSYYGIEIWL